MEKYDLNEGNEALKRVLLMMKYDNKKTLVENTSLIFEQTDVEYFDTVVKSYMKNPQNITINYGSPKIDPIKNAQAFQKAIGGIGREISGLDYIINKTFNNISDSISMFKAYPEVAEESLYDAIEGEWFSGNLMKTIVNKVSTQMKSWCSLPANSKQEICIIKSKEEIKYGI